MIYFIGNTGHDAFASFSLYSVDGKTKGRFYLKVIKDTEFLKM